MEAIGGIVGGVAGGIGNWLGNKQAAKAQRQAIAAQEKWRQENLALAQPYLDAGSAALSKRNDILGLNGEDAQTNALAALSNDQNWQAQMDAINKTVTRNAVARGQTGGNLLAALADRAQQYKYSQIQDYLGALQGDINVGQNALSQFGGVGTSTANNISNLTSGVGQSKGAGISNLFQGAGNALKAYQLQQGRNSVVGGI